MTYIHVVHRLYTYCTSLCDVADEYIHTTFYHTTSFYLVRQTVLCDFSHQRPRLWVELGWRVLLRIVIMTYDFALTVIALLCNLVVGSWLTIMLLLSEILIHLCRCYRHLARLLTVYDDFATVIDCLSFLDFSFLFFIVLVIVGEVPNRPCCGTQVPHLGHLCSDLNPNILGVHIVGFQIQLIIFEV